METTTSPWFTRRFMSSFPGFFQRICPTKRPPTNPIGSCLLNASRIPKAINKCHINLPIVHQILMDTSHLGKFPFIVFPNMHACTANQDFFSPKSKRGIYDSLCQQTRKDKTNGFSLPPNKISILLPLFFSSAETTLPNIFPFIWLIQTFPIYLQRWLHLSFFDNRKSVNLSK